MSACGTTMTSDLDFELHTDERGMVFLRVGHRMYPAMEHDKSDTPVCVDDPGSPIFNHVYRVRRARLGFESGWAMSVIFGTMTYCENRDRYGDPGNPGGQFGLRNVEPHTKFSESPATVEVMVFPPEHYDGDRALWAEPFGWQNVNQVQELIDLLNNGGVS